MRNNGLMKETLHRAGGRTLQLLAGAEEFQVHLRGRDAPLEKLMIDIHHEGLWAAEIVIGVATRDQRFDQRSVHKALAVKAGERSIPRGGRIVARVGG